MSMPRLAILPTLLACILVPVLAGCGDKVGPGFANNEKLPSVDADSALAVDEGRVAVATPKGWVRAPRSKDYLVRYQRAAKKEFPSVTVTAGDPPEGIRDVTADTQKQFVEAITEKLGETFSKKAKNSLTVAPRPVRLGNHLGVGWASPGKSGTGSSAKPIDRLAFAVVINGRQYTVEARGLKGKLEPADKLAAKAVSAALAVPKPSEPEPEPEPEAKPEPTEPAPAENEAAEPKAEPEPTPSG